MIIYHLILLLTTFVVFCQSFEGVVPKYDQNLQSSEAAPIVAIGNKFFNSKTGEQFFIKGIAYQRSRREGEVFDRTKEPPYVDSLADTTTCLRDLENLIELGVNVVRVYSIDPNANHDACMKAFSREGIYVLADLSESETSINRDSPAWDVTLYNRYTAVVDALHKYDNVLGFFAGNEVTNSVDNTNAAPFVRAAIRDVKKYITLSGFRKIPVGYASNDDPEIRKDIANYFVCENSDSRCSGADFFGINTYEWCGYSTYATSGYRELTYEFNQYPIPVFFSEYGCNTINPRPFTEIETLYGSTMTKVWSGGIAYEYFEEVNRYGVVKENLDGSITKLEDFDYLKHRLNSVNPQGISMEDQKSLEPIVVGCLEQTGSWKASTKLPPKPDQGKCECLWYNSTCISEDYSIFDKLCPEGYCEEVIGDGINGVYGRFSDCEAKQRLSYAIGQYYADKGDKDEQYCQAKHVLLGSPPNKLADGRTCKEILAFNPQLKEVVRYSNGTKNSTIYHNSTGGRTNNNLTFSKASSSGTSIQVHMVSFVFSCLLIYVSILFMT
ncbi:uncharacterized protein RJT20DRAFT_125736 [Scheffersomyces xylosifermentans]|uniref:uncharacterized protein n=1 Tax=Scheffersomyces xylosifermentans TaxID=1304137 RepID=UPI00315CA867